MPSYLSGNDESFVDVEPNKKSNKTSTEGQGTCINVEENVVKKMLMLKMTPTILRS